MTAEQKKKLERKLWDIANELRGKMSADEFRDYILGFIFYKYLSEKMHLYANKILEQDGIEYLSIDETSADGEAYLQAVRTEAVAELGYMLKPSELFSRLAESGQAGEFILDDLTKIMNNIEQSTLGTESEQDFDKLFEDLDLTSTKLGRSENQKNELIAKVIVHLDMIDFELENIEGDVLGDAYEYLIGQFASGAGKKAGEFYTPSQVSTILAKFVTMGKDRIKNVYDPTCGSGSLLLRVERELAKDAKPMFYGQELNRTTFNLARMNMLLHDVHYRRFDIRQENTLTHPAKEHTDLKFEAIVANPPFSAKWSANQIFESDDRFSQYGRLAPKSKADFAFIQHMIHHLDENGTMAIILPHGVLFRGAAEGHIRRYLIEDRNYLDAVIGLPANIFYGTSIPTCILVFKKCRENPDDILFIDASEGYEKAKNKNALLSDHIDAIVEGYAKREFKDKFAYVAPLSEIAENDYNLNIPRYVDTFEPEPEVDLKAVTEELVRIDAKMGALDAKIAGYCEGLGIEAPV
ncbi:type I restriction-modification system subunit M [Litorimonas sp.]|uniref:type I restriction-modification system subunit M n=1 Tax=Litorimonas sp. TaxID=1892381 RepID=UPI003A8AF824